MVDINFEGLAYTRWVLWTVYTVFAGIFWIKHIACFILFVFYLWGEYFWPKNSAMFGLVQSLPPPLLEWWHKKQAKAPAQ